MGKELVENVIDNTGLPDDLARNEFTRLLAKYQVTEETLTLETLREILADHLQDVLCAAKEHHESGTVRHEA